MSGKRAVLSNGRVEFDDGESLWTTDPATRVYLADLAGRPVYRWRVHCEPYADETGKPDRTVEVKAYTAGEALRSAAKEG